MHSALLRFLAWPRREEGAYPQWSVTDEQRRPGQKAEQPPGRERFGASGGVARFLQTTAGMRVARALPYTPKRSRAKCMGISTDSSVSTESQPPTEVLPDISLRSFLPTLFAAP